MSLRKRNSTLTVSLTGLAYALSSEPVQKSNHRNPKQLKSKQPTRPSTPQLPLKTPQKPSNRGHKALNIEKSRSTLKFYNLHDESTRIQNWRLPLRAQVTLGGQPENSHVCVQEPPTAPRF